MAFQTGNFLSNHLVEEGGCSVDIINPQNSKTKNGSRF